MFRPSNPDIDTERLATRVRIERDRPPTDAAARQDGPTEPLSLAQVTPQIGLGLRLKYRLRSIPLLGPFLVRVNAWRRRFRPRHALRSATLRIRREFAMAPSRLRPAMAARGPRWLLAFAKWAKSLLHLNRMRTDLHRMAQHMDDLTERLERVGDRADRLHGDVLFQQRRLDALIDRAGAASADGAHESRPGETAGATPPAARASAVSNRLANVYEAFEDHFRGTRAEIKQRQAVYLDAVRAAGAGRPDRPVLDIGCGRGEWLELLGDAGLVGHGVDVNPMAVATCREHGLDAREQDLFTALSAAGDGALGAVTAFHVAEHMTLETLVAFLDAARTALAPGGLLILETPNPENLVVGAHTFHADPTHRAPIPPAVGKFLVTQRGFADAAIWRLHPVADAPEVPGDDPGTKRLNALLNGPQDYAVLASRP